VIDLELSIGDYVLTNGTLAAAVVIDALSRFVPGVLGEEKSLTHESFTGKLLDFPQYTRPAEFRGMSVPEVLLSGNHAEIEKWRSARAMEKTRSVRPIFSSNFQSNTNKAKAMIDHQGNHRKPGEEGHSAVQSRRRRARAHQGSRGRQGADSDLFRHCDRAQGIGNPRDLHGQEDQLWRGVERVFPVNSPNIEKIEIELESEP